MKFLHLCLCLLSFLACQSTAQTPVPTQFFPIEPKFEFIFEAKVTIDSVIEVGVTTYGKRRIIPITGGTFEGAMLKGIIIPGGADWQTIRADGSVDLEARYTLKTNDGVLIYIQNKGIRVAKPEVMARMMKGEKVDPKEYYFRTTATFEVAEGKYDWLSKCIVVSSAIRMKDDVWLRFYKVL
jgi:Protein of unknown function (DUF3237)